LGFAAPVAQNGYSWWYIDGLSADGRQGITLIAFLGSVFSPYYALARRRGRGDPLDHCALNVSLYGSANRWAMTERGRQRLVRDASSLVIGPSSLTWDGTMLTIRIDEWTAPWPSRIRGTVRLRPDALTDRIFPLDAAGQHRWRPIAPCSTIEVTLDEPALRWSGSAYFDLNAGDGPLDEAFHHWDWSRAIVPSGTAIFYDVKRKAGDDLSIAMHVDRTGCARTLDGPPVADLPRTLWRMPRMTRADAGHRPALLRTFEDSPFYARSLVASHLMGGPVTAIHESLSLDRFRTPWVKALLPFRIPRFDR
jgi:carotenoid 1,2-hydratase